MPQVSVIIPAYNAEAYIAETLQSVLDQTFRDFELIVVDDGSTDRTVEVATSLPGVTCLRQTNAGVSAARNHGVRRSSGALIAFLDADDLWHPAKLAAQVALMARHPDCDLSRTHLTELHPGTERPWQAVDLRSGEPPHQLIHDLRTSFCSPYFATSTVMVRRSAFARAGGFDEKLPYAEDVDFYLKVLIDNPQVAVLAFDAIYKRPVPGSLGDDSVAGYVKLIGLYHGLLARRPELAQRDPQMVADALHDLYVRQAFSLLRAGRRGPALGSALRSLKYKRTLPAFKALAGSCLPTGLARGARSLARPGRSVR